MHIIWENGIPSNAYAQTIIQTNSNYVNQIYKFPQIYHCSVLY